MQTVPQRRSRVAAGNGLPKQDVSIGELRQRLTDAADLHGVSSTARVVLNALAMRAGLAPDRRECRRGTVVQRHWVRADGFHVLLVWPGEDWLAEKVGKDPRTIRRAIKELVAAGLIERKPRAGGAPGSRNGANLSTETHLLVPPKDRMPKARLRFHGSAEDLAARTRAGDPKARAALVEAAKALSEWTRETVDAQAEQARRMVKGFVNRAERDVLAVIASIGGGPVGFYASLPKPAQARGTLLCGIDGEDTPKASGSMDLRQNGEDIFGRTVRTDLSSPLITVRRTLKNQTNQTNATASIDTEPQPVGVGLDCFAGQADEPSEPAEPSDPACPVEVIEPEQNCPIGEEGDPTLAGLDADQRESVLNLWPDGELRQSIREAAAKPNTGQRSGSLEDRFGLRKSDIWRMILKWPRASLHRLVNGGCWRDLEGLRREMDGESTDGFFDEDTDGPPAAAPAPRSMNGLVERMVTNGMARNIAEALYEQHKRYPERIRQAMFEVERAVKEGNCRNPAGLIVSKLNKAAKRSSPANAAKSDHWAD